MLRTWEWLLRLPPVARGGAEEEGASPMQALVRRRARLPCLLAQVHASALGLVLPAAVLPAWVRPAWVVRLQLQRGRHLLPQ